MIDAISTPNVQPEILPCIFLAELKNREMVEVASFIKHLLAYHPSIVRSVRIIKLLRLRVVYNYLSKTAFKDVEILKIG